MEIITAHYGTAVGGFIVGGGYGKDRIVTDAADKIALRLVAEFGLPVSKRGNSDGKSASAWHRRGKNGWEDWFGVGFRLPNSRYHDFDCSGRQPHYLYHAMFDAPVSKLKEIQRIVKNAHISESNIRAGKRYFTVYSDNFLGLDTAIAWLKIFGGRYCPKLHKSARSNAL